MGNRDEDSERDKNMGSERKEKEKIESEKRSCSGPCIMHVTVKIMNLL